MPAGRHPLLEPDQRKKETGHRKSDTEDRRDEDGGKRRYGYEHAQAQPHDRHQGAQAVTDRLEPCRRKSTGVSGAAQLLTNMAARLAGEPGHERPRQRLELLDERWFRGLRPEAPVRGGRGGPEPVEGDKVDHHDQTGDDPRTDGDERHQASSAVMRWIKTLPITINRAATPR